MFVSRNMVKGLTISAADGHVGAIAAVHGFVVAMRDIAPFLACGSAGHESPDAWDLGSFYAANVLFGEL